MSKQIIIASQNPVKIQAVRSAFGKVFPNEDFFYNPCSVSSGVSNQPSTDQETLQGAFNRTRSARIQYPSAHYWVGIEGGVDKLAHQLLAFAWVVISGHHQTGSGRTGSFFLPQTITDLIYSGYELGIADDIVFGRHNSKQEEGAVGLLTHGALDRKNLYEPAVLLALIPFLNPELYPAEK